MKGYSKLRLVNKSRSIDFSDLSATKTSPDQSQKTHEKFSPDTNKTHDNQDSKNEGDQDDQEANSEKNSSVGAKYLSKNHSVSSATSSHRFKMEMQRNNTTTRRSGLLQSALKRAFSMRRYYSSSSSSSVVSQEKYCRIHDQCIAVLPDDDDVEEDVFEAVEDNNGASMETVRSMDEKKKYGSKGRILKACKRILGF